MTRARRAVDWRFAALALGLALLLGLFGRIAGTDPDEEYALASTAHGLVYALHRALYYELQAPVWFGIVALWRGLDSSVTFARLFSIACAAGTCFALRSIALRLRPRLDPFAFVALVVLNPFFIYAALEVRVYAFALLLGALSWIAFYDGYFAGESRSARLRFGLLALISIYTFYYLGFMLVGCVAALIVARRFAALRAFVPLTVVLALASVPALLVVRATFAEVRAALPPMSGASLRAFVEPVLLFVLPTGYRWSEVPALAALLHVYKPLVLGLIAIVLLARPRIGARELGLAALAAAIWLAYPLVYLLVHVRFEVPRHYVTLFVPLAAAAYAVLATLAVGAGAWRRVALGAVLAAYVACCGLTLWSTYGTLSKAGDMRRVGAYVSAHAVRGDLVAVFAPDAKPAFQRFYAGPAPVVAFPREPDPERYDTAAYVVHSIAEADAALDRLAPHQRLWFVLYGRCAPNSDNYGCFTVSSALRARYPDARVSDFYEAEVVEIEARPGRKNAGRSAARGSSIAQGEIRAWRLKKAAFSTIASA
jgi:hypothetical protein